MSSAKWQPFCLSLNVLKKWHLINDEQKPLPGLPNRAGASTQNTSTSTGKSVLEYYVFSIFMFIILGKTSTRVVLAPALLPKFLEHAQGPLLLTWFNFNPSMDK